MKPSVIGTIAVTVLASVSLPAWAQESAEAFYETNDITLIVGSSAGGGFDTYARLIARYMGQYIPGEPEIIVQNMPGSGSNTAAAHIYNIAPQDGTHIAAIFPGAVIGPILGNPVQHDPARFNYIGNANADVYVCLTRADTGVETLGDAFETEVVIGASSPGASTRDFPAMLVNLLDARFHIVGGYPGTTEIGLALEQGEVEGQCGTSWASISASNPGWFEDGAVNVIAQEALRPHPQLEEMGVPMAIDFAADDEERRVMELIYSQTEFGRPYITGPDVPAERVDILREAFQSALNDPDLMAAAQAANLELNSMGGAELQALVEDIFATPAELVERARAAVVAD